ncbi:MAG: argininosuccinate synthase [Firmicutes bacterium]|nr:argininosuccinate synthase [Bacillota bacterium]
MSKKIVLAYSGGLDTTVMIPWLKENQPNSEVIPVCVDVGQCNDYEAVKQRAAKTGAGRVHIINAREEFVTDFLFPMLKAQAVYNGKYLLGTAIARPLIAKKLVDIALKENAAAICHGATGKGNDQIRFELTVKAFAPQLQIIAPWRVWELKSRDEEMEFLRVRNIEAPMKKEQSYSRDDNLWHISHEGLELENPAVGADYKRLLQMSVPPQDAPDKPECVELAFEKGIPVTLNGKHFSPVALLEELNKIGGRNGVGVIDIVENRIVGMKSRGVYETPGGTVLYAAHAELENLCLDRKTASFKQTVSHTLGELIYAGEWYTPLREALSAFVDKTQETLTGKVRLKLYKGNLIPNGSESPYSLYNEEMASFTTGGLYSHQDAEGFINLTGLPLTVRALMNRRTK